MSGIVVYLRFGTGWMEDSSGQRSGRSATVFLGSMYITDPLLMIPLVIRILRMKRVVKKTVRSWVTFLETRMPQKVCMPKTSIFLLHRAWDTLQDHKVQGEASS